MLQIGPGSGGEYDVQTGFGWTNGVALSLLAKYGDRISPDDYTSGSTTCGNISTVVTTAAVLIWFYVSQR